MFDPPFRDTLFWMALTGGFVLGGTTLLAVLLIGISRFVREGIPQPFSANDYDPPVGEGGLLSRRKAKRKPHIASPPTRPMTDEDVLAVLLATLPSMLNKKNVEWEASTPLAEVFSILWGFASALDNDADNGMRQSLGAVFGTWLGELSFRKATHPPEAKTLNDLARFIASSARVPIVDPPTEETAFDIVRRVFASQGADVSRIRPSSPVKFRPFQMRRLRGQLTKLSLGRIPYPSPATINRFALHPCWVPLFYLAGMICVLTMEFPAAVTVYLLVRVAAALVLLTLSAVSAIWIVFCPIRQRLGNCETFGDVSRAIAAAHAQSGPPSGISRDQTGNEVIGRLLEVMRPYRMSRGEDFA